MASDSEGKKRQRGYEDADHSSSEEEGRKAPRLHSSTEDDDNISVATVATATHLSEELKKDLSSSLRESVCDETRAIQTTEKKTKDFIETYRQKIDESNTHESSICNALLGLDHDAESTLEDVVVCRAQFEFAAEFVSGNKNILITRHSLFQRFLYPAIQLAWKFVVDKYNRQNSQNMIEDKTISWKVASLFYWNVGNPYKKNVMVGHSPLKYTNFQSLLKDVQGLFQYHLTQSQISGRRISPPKADNVVSFFQVEKEIEQPQKNEISWLPQQTQRKLNQLREQYVTGLIEPKTYVAELFKIWSQGDGNDNGADFTNTLKSLQELNGGGLSTASDFSEVVDILKIEISNVTNLGQEAENSIVNNPLSSAFLFARIVRGMMKRGKELLPLDVVTGATPNQIYEDEVNEGSSTPSVSLYIQQHEDESDKDFFNVVTLSNYLTENFRRKCLNESNTSMHYPYKKKSYLRVVTDYTEKNLDAFQEKRPGVTFSSGNKRKVYESDASKNAIKESERELLAMSSTFHEWVEETKLFILRFGIAPTTERVEAMKKNAAEHSVNTNCTQTQHQHEHQQRQHQQRQVREVINHSPDTIVALVSQANQYEPHSDTSDKPENYCEIRPEKAMSILTHGIVANSQSSGDDGHSPEDKTMKIASIRHGHSGSGSDNLKFCETLGSFSFSLIEKDFRWNNDAGRDGIPLFGLSHGHFQCSGTQGRLKHCIQPTRSFQQSKNARVIYSMRKLSDTIDHRDSMFAMNGVDLKSVVIDRKYQNIYRVVGNIRGEEESRQRGGSTTTTEVETEASRKAKKRKKTSFERTTHQNGQLNEEEMVNRDRIISCSQRVKPIMMIKSTEAVKNLYDLRLSMTLLEEDLRKSLVGPVVDTDDRDDTTHYLRKPGTLTDPCSIDNLYEISSNNHHDEVLNNNALHLRRIGKNDFRLLNNIKTVLDGKGELDTMFIRGPGGAAELAGIYPSILGKTKRDDPTHMVASSQNVSGVRCENFLRLIEHQSVVNVWFNGLYLGPFSAESGEIRAKRDYEIFAEKQKMSMIVDQICNKYPEQAAKIKLSPASLNEQDGEIQAMSAPSLYILLKPLDTHILDKWSGGVTNVRWGLVNMKAQYVVRPTVYVPRNNICNLFGSFKRYKSWIDLLRFGQRSKFPFLNEEGVKEVKRAIEDMTMIGDNADFGNEIESWCFKAQMMKQKTLYSIYTEITQENDHSDVEEESYQDHSQGVTFNDIIACALRSAATTQCRIVHGVKEDDLSVIHPPRLILEVEGDSTAAKLFVVKPIHPPFFTPHMDTVAGIATIATGVHHIESESRKGKYFVQDSKTKELAWTILFKATISTILNPTVIIQLYLKRHSKEEIEQGSYEQLLPSPLHENEVSNFIESIESYEWINQRCVHRNFSAGRNQVFPSLNSLTSFITEFRTVGKSIMEKAAKQGSRDEALKVFQSDLESVCHVKLSNFQMTVLFRTFEVCIEEPFGSVRLVYMGPGSMASAELLSKSLECVAAEVPEKLLSYLNQLGEKDANSDLFSVIGLEYDSLCKSLVHRSGLRKKLCLNDVEHMLCMFSSVLSLTFPNANNQVRSNASIDGPKYFPIRCSVVTSKCGQIKWDKPASKLPVLRPLFQYSEQTLQVFNKVSKEDTFPLKSSLFKIDIEGPSQEQDGELLLDYDIDTIKELENARIRQKELLAELEKVNAKIASLEATKGREKEGESS